MDTRVRRAAALVTAVLVAGLLAGPVQVADAEAPAAPASASASVERSGANQAPVVTNDRFTMTPLTYGAEVHVLRNDSDPESGNLQICRLEAPDDSGLGVHIWSSHGEPGDGVTPSRSTYLLLEPSEELEAGTLTITYYACDRRSLTPATLTVDVVEITAEKVVGRPGVVRFTNPLGHEIYVIWGAPSGEDIDGEVVVAPHASKDVKVRSRNVFWAAYDPKVLEGEGDDPIPLGYGILHNTGARSVGGTARSFPASLERAWRADRTAVDHGRRPGTPIQRDDPPADLPTEPAEDTTAPVAVDDRVTVDYYDTVAVRVLDNDSDDTPGDLAVCWVDVRRGVGLSASPAPWWASSARPRSDSPDRYVDLTVSPARAGTYRLTYYACDKHRMTPATLTVTVRRFPPLKARRVPRHPGTVVFINRGYRGVRVNYYESSGYSEKTQLWVPPHGRRRLHVRYDDLSFFAGTKIGPLNYGQVRNLYPGHRKRTVGR